jgi:hypothetical protein
VTPWRFHLAIALAAACGSPAAMRTAGHHTMVAAVEAEPPCFRASAVPQYIGVGWTHFVDVANDCEVPIECEVSTTVDPSPTIPVVVQVADTVRVRTRYGSNTWVFRPVVRCRATA